MISLLLSLILSFHSFAADDCPAVDISTKDFLATEFLQGERDWCFAFAAAASVSSLQKISISAEDLAIHHNLRELQAEASADESLNNVVAIPLGNLSAQDVLNFAGGSISEAGNLLALKGYCTEKKAVQVLSSIETF